MTGSSKKTGLLARFTEPKTQPSLFHYIKEEPEPSVFEDFDWSFLRHPVRAFKEAWKAPRTKPSLFHYVEEEPKTPFSLKEIFSDLLTGYRNPLFIPSVFSDPDGLALERAQGYLKLPNGRTLTGHSHDYKRNGTTTLFAAFEVATGKVMAAHKKRRRRVEFLDFMNDIVAAHADTAIHVILDNLNTHKPKNDRWLKRHPNVHFHFTPTRASWLNQVEIWFSILQGKSLHGASFTSVAQLREHIDAFIESYNQHAKPFVWTKARVHQKLIKARFAEQ